MEEEDYFDCHMLIAWYPIENAKANPNTNTDANTYTNNRQLVTERASSRKWRGAAFLIATCLLPDSQLKIQMQIQIQIQIQRQTIDS